MGARTAVKALLVLGLIGTALLAGFGCASWSKAEKGAVIAGATGAVVGGVIGDKAGNTAVGAILGAAVGGAAGAYIGDYMDKQAQEMDLRMHSAVEITLKDGRTFDSGVVERGADRWNQVMLEDKFRWLLGYVLPAGSPVIEQAIELLQSFEDVGHVHELTRMLQ